MTQTATLFLAFVAALALLVVFVAAWRFRARTATAIAIGLPLWLAYVGALSWSGLIADTTLRPPAIFYVVGPVVLFVMIVMVRSKAGGRLALAVPLWALLGLQVYRIGVELFLRQLWAEGLVPRMLTFEGANVDLWIGITAPVAAKLSTCGRRGRQIALAWNAIGLLSLANVIVRSALTSPGPLNLIHAEVANHAIGTFPYTFIAGFFAPLAVILHVLALRSIAARRPTPAVPKGLPA